jgi:hypothetical protein
VYFARDTPDSRTNRAVHADAELRRAADSGAQIEMACRVASHGQTKKQVMCQARNGVERVSRHRLSSGEDDPSGEVSSRRDTLPFADLGRRREERVSAWFTSRERSPQEFERCRDSLTGHDSSRSFGSRSRVPPKPRPSRGDCTESVLLGSERWPELNRSMCAVRKHVKAGEAEAAIALQRKVVRMRCHNHSIK